MVNLTELPSDLPHPLDDGAADHLPGMKLPQVTLRATTGVGINVGAISGLLVVYCYPMTGQPNVALPEGWDQIPGARGCTPQSCSFRDHHQEIQDLGAAVMGLSVQSTEYQTKMAQWLHLPFPVLPVRKQYPVPHLAENTDHEMKHSRPYSAIRYLRCLA